MSEIQVNIFQDGTVFFPSVVCEKNVSLTLRSFNGIYLFSQLPAYCLWTCLGYTILLFAQAFPECWGPDKGNNETHHDSSVPPQTPRNTCHLLYSSCQGLQALPRLPKGESERRSNLPRVAWLVSRIPGWNASSLHWPGTSFTRFIFQTLSATKSISLDFIGLIRINIRRKTG